MTHTPVVLNVRTVFFIFVLLFQWSSLLSVAYAEDNVVVIVNANLPLDALSKTEIMNIFLGKKTTWGNGTKITFVTLKEGETHKMFLRTFVNRNPSQFKNHWKKMLFTGKGVVPKAFDTDEALLDFVAQNENTIGYVSPGVTGSGIKVAKISN